MDEARVRRTFVFSNRTVANMKELLSLGIAASETEIIEESIFSLVADVENKKAFSKKRVRKNYSFRRDTIQAMDVLVEKGLVRNENEAIDLAIERLATMYLMRENAAELFVPLKEDDLTNERDSKKNGSALARRH